MKLYENIKLRRMALNLTQEELAEKVGYTGKSMISKIERGLVDLSQSKIETFATALNTTSEQLFGDIEDIRNYIEYPVIGSVKAGYNGLIYSELDDKEQIPLDWISGDSPDSYFILRVKGDSMYPLVLDTDRILVHKCNSVTSGSLAVIRINDEEATLKRVIYKPGEDWLELQSVNPSYPPKRIEGEALEHCQVIGEVKRLIRKF